jgi:hypothetical protein
MVLYPSLSTSHGLPESPGSQRPGPWVSHRAQYVVIVTTPVSSWVDWWNWQPGDTTGEGWVRDGGMGRWVRGG